MKSLQLTPRILVPLALAVIVLAVALHRVWQ
jgi:hypothetical protein